MLLAHFPSHEAQTGVNDDQHIKRKPKNKQRKKNAACVRNEHLNRK